MDKRRLHAALIQNGTTFRRWALANNYNPRTVIAVVDRWAGKKSFPNGAMSRRILRDLSIEIGREVIPGLHREMNK